MDSETSLLRILDAAANRAGEGLRVIEDYVRFVLDDRNLTVVAKQLRHALAAAIGRIPATERHAARDTLADVGADVGTASETNRSDLAHVVAASFQRLEQALRSLEEYAKLIDPGIAGQFESLRYETYTLERAVNMTAESVRRLADARLYVVIDGRGSLGEFGMLAESLVAAGVDILQLRDKRLADRDLLERARRLREITAGSNVLSIINDRPDIAVLARAHGVHVGQDELSVKEARSIVGPRLLVGVSTHSLEQARRAVLDGANYIGVGPTFPSDTKCFEHFTGLELLRDVAAEVCLPAFAIGGIGLKNVSDVLATGIGRVAISGAVLASTDPANAARQLRELLHRPES
ncbi:MAG TPA: thiamine phosphate synthase [Pirellulales bacterium]|jgi:thiamine-phosphate pyrophosphorylase|nr:thiamine phosphate synthase [Pirellulales bacterium]